MSNPSSTKKCVLISTGGTIASHVDPTTGLANPELSGSALIRSIPELSAVAEIEIIEPFCIASPHIQPETHWPVLLEITKQQLERKDISCVVITHGTALMEETAWFLDLTLNTEKPVILTGAQRNASHTYTDGPFNILSAVRTGLHPATSGLGVLIVMNQRIHSARDARKHHTFDVDAFTSGDCAIVGAVTPDGVEIRRRREQRHHIRWNGSTLPSVAVLPMYAGAKGDLIHAAATAYSGIVIQGVGAGHVNESMYEAIREVMQDGCAVVVTTRIPKGGARACYGFNGSSQQLKDAGAIIAGDLQAYKARILLMLVLAAGLSPYEVFSNMDTGPW